MDPLTHAASGAALMLAIPGRPATRLAAPLAAAVCASPDIDLAFIHTPLEFLLLHRGITHSLAFAPFFGVALALLCFPLWRKSTPLAWSFSRVWLLCILLILLHIWLDIFTTYGTMIFLPFSHFRVRLNSIYMIDLLITIPLLWAVCFRRKKPRAQISVLVWIIILPCAGFGLNCLHHHSLSAAFAKEKKDVAQLRVLPDMFAPFFWRAIYLENGRDPRVLTMGLDWLGRPRTKPASFPAADEALVKKLADCSTEGRVYFDFALLPAMENLPERLKPEKPNPEDRFLLFYDMRFGSDIDWIKKLLAKRPDADLPFLFMAELIPEESGQEGAEEKIAAIRLRFSDSGKDSQWHKPIPPEKPTAFQWLMGLQ